MSSILSQVISGRRKRPRRTVLYGTHGIGKTTWAASWPKPIVIATEDGAADVDVDKTPLLTDWNQVGEAAFELSAEHCDLPYATVVLDSADWLERLIHKDIVKSAGKPNITSIDDIGYGKGHTETATRMGLILSALNGCRDRGLHVVIIAHCEVKRFESPEGDSYDRCTPKLHKQSASLLQEWADEVLFATYKTFTKREDLGFNKTRNVGVGTGERVLKTCERPGFLAKNRLGLPEELPFDFEAYRPYITAGNVAGGIVNGSSKV